MFVFLDSIESSVSVFAASDGGHQVKVHVVPAFSRTATIRMFELRADAPVLRCKHVISESILLQARFLDSRLGICFEFLITTICLFLDTDGKHFKENQLVISSLTIPARVIADRVKSNLVGVGFVTDKSISVRLTVTLSVVSISKSLFGPGERSL